MIWCLAWLITVHTHGKMKSICFILQKYSVVVWRHLWSTYSLIAYTRKNQWNCFIFMNYCINSIDYIVPWHDPQMEQQKEYVPKWRHDKMSSQAFHAKYPLDPTFLHKYIRYTRSNNLKRWLKDNYQIVMQTFFRKK